MNNILEFPKTMEFPRNKGSYLLTLKKYLEKDDYEEILCAILDEEYYLQLDAQLIPIVDNYFTI
jgi:uncharacterized protein YcgL (UPF0745 family)